MIKTKKGFIATSLIYSFFLVFLLIMVIVLVSTKSIRVNISKVKEDIRVDMDNNANFVLKKLENRSYTLGEEISYGGEKWYVLSDNSSSATLILSRGLSALELENAIGKKTNDSHFYDGCNSSYCKLRGCIIRFLNSNLGEGLGNEFCYRNPTYNTQLYNGPLWLPNNTQRNTIGNVYSGFTAGETLSRRAVTNWINNHSYLSKAIRKDALVKMNFSDGKNTYNDYVRIPTISEANSLNTENGTNIRKVLPFHLLNITGNVGTINVCAGDITSVAVSAKESYTSAFVRPVIELKKS